MAFGQSVSSRKTVSQKGLPDEIDVIICYTFENIGNSTESYLKKVDFPEIIQENY